MALLFTFCAAAAIFDEKEKGRIFFFIGAMLGSFTFASCSCYDFYRHGTGNPANVDSLENGKTYALLGTPVREGGKWLCFFKGKDKAIAVLLDEKPAEVMVRGVGDDGKPALFSLIENSEKKSTGVVIKNPLVEEEEESPFKAEPKPKPAKQPAKKT
jgi:hypothetical protein